MAAIADTIKKMLGIKSALSDVHASITSVREQLRSAGQRLEFLKCAPLPLDETADRIAADIHARGQQFVQRFTMHRDNYSEPGRIQTSNDGEVTFCRSADPNAQVFATGYNTGQADKGEVLHDFLCFAFPEELAAAAKRALAEFDWSASGPPCRERIADLDRVMASIAELEQQEQEIVDSARELGINL